MDNKAEECKNQYIFEKVDIITQGTMFFCNQYLCLHDHLVSLAESAKKNILKENEVSETSKRSRNKKY